MRDSVPSTDIPAFVMYCVNGESGSSLLIESTDSMIHVATPVTQRIYHMYFIIIIIIIIIALQYTTTKGK